MVASGVSTTGSGVIRPPADSEEYCSSRRTGADSSGSISPSSRSWMPSGSSASRSAASSGSIASRMSAALASSRCASNSFWSSSDSSWMTSASRSSSSASATSYRSSGLELAQDAGGVRRPQPLEGGEHLLRTADRMAGQLRRIHPADVGPADHLHRGPADDPAGPFPDGQAGDHPVPAPGPFDRRRPPRSPNWRSSPAAPAHPATGRSAAAPASAARIGAGSPIRWTTPRRAIPGCRPAASARRSAAWSAVRRRARARGGVCDPAAEPPRCPEPCRSIHHWARTPAARRAGRRRLVLGGGTRIRLWRAVRNDAQVGSGRCGTSQS